MAKEFSNNEFIYEQDEIKESIGYKVPISRKDNSKQKE